MPLPTPAEVNSQLTLLTARTAGVKVCYDTEHPQPVTLAELLNIQKNVATYFREQVDAHLKEQHPK